MGTFKLSIIHPVVKVEIVDDKVTKAMTYGGFIVAFFGMWLLGQTLQSSSNFESGYMLSIAPALITAMGYTLAALGALLGKTHTAIKIVAVIVIVICIVIVVMRILGYYMIIQSHGAS